MTHEVEPIDAPDTTVDDGKGGYKKFDNGKPELKYILDTPLSTAEIAKVRKFGDDKYGRLNWYKCDNAERYISAVLRHLFANGDQGITKDPESGLDHLAHALCSLQFFYELKLREQALALKAYGEIEQPTGEID